MELDTRYGYCTECLERPDKLISLNSDDHHPAVICESCLEKALDLIKDGK